MSEWDGTCILCQRGLVNSGFLYFESQHSGQCFMSDGVVFCFRVERYHVYSFVSEMSGIL